MQRRRGLTKAQSQTRHAKRRAIQRFGAALTATDIRSIVASIQSGAARFHLRQSNRVSLFEVRHSDRDMLAVYDSKRHTIITFLTFDMVTYD